MVTPKRYEIGCQLLLITNRKSYTGFWLVPTSMTLNDLERSNSPYFVVFAKFYRFSGRLYISGWRFRHIMSRKISSPSSSLLLLAKTKTQPAARSLCDSWASCFRTNAFGKLCLFVWQKKTWTGAFAMLCMQQFAECPRVGRSMCMHTIAKAKHFKRRLIAVVF